MSQPIILPQKVADRMHEAIAAPNMQRWRSLAYLAGLEADVLQRNDPDSLIGHDVRAISEWAHGRYMDMMPELLEEAA